MADVSANDVSGTVSEEFFEEDHEGTGTETLREETENGTEEETENIDGNFDADVLLQAVTERGEGAGGPMREVMGWAAHMWDKL